MKKVKVRSKIWEYSPEDVWEINGLLRFPSDKPSKTYSDISTDEL